MAPGRFGLSGQRWTDRSESVRLLGASSPVRRLSLAWAAKAGLGIALLIFAVRGVDFRLVAGLLRQVHLLWVVAALGTIVLSACLKALRWRWLLAGAPSRVGFFSPLGALLVGQALNMLAWARAGDVARIWLLEVRTQVGAVGIAASVVAEKILDAFMIAWLAWLLMRPTGYLSSAALAVLLLASIAGVSILAFGVWRGRRLADWLTRWMVVYQVPGRVRLSGWMAAAAEALEPLADRRRLLSVLGLSLFVWAAAWLTNELLFLALGLALPASAGLLALVLIYVGVAPGLMPTNIGPFYFLAALALRSHGAPQAASLAFAALLHFLVVLVPLTGGLAFLSFHSFEKAGLRRLLLDRPSPTN